MIKLLEEQKILKSGAKIVIGIDEVGRGSIAGPVCASVCGFYAKDLLALKKVIAKTKKFHKINDSKKLTSKIREELAKTIKNDSLLFSATASISQKIIDKINIQNASELAMRKAIGKLKLSSLKDVFLLIDGNRLKNKYLSAISHKLIIKGDGKVFLIAAASIIAKTFRDKLMMKYGKIFPKYGFAKHKGYGTKKHFDMIKQHGLSKIHRRTFNINSKVKSQNYGSTVLTILSLSKDKSKVKRKR